MKVEGSFKDHDQTLTLFSRSHQNFLLSRLFNFFGEPHLSKNLNLKKIFKKTKIATNLKENINPNPLYFQNQTTKPTPPLFITNSVTIYTSLNKKVTEGLKVLEGLWCVFYFYILEVSVIRDLKV